MWTGAGCRARLETRARDRGRDLSNAWIPTALKPARKSLQSWLEKNAALIHEVDARVAEVAPLAYPTPPGVDLVMELHGQVKQILLEPMFLKKTPEERAAICKKEADPVQFEVEQRWDASGAKGVGGAERLEDSGSSAK